MPRSSRQDPGRRILRRSRSRASSSPGSGDGMTTGTVLRHRAATRGGSATISGIPRGRSSLPLKRERKLRMPMQVKTSGEAIVPPSSAVTTGAAGPRERLSKNGPVISTANNHPAPSIFLNSFFFFSQSALVYRYF